MVKKIIPILIFIVFPYNFFGQNIDSLNTELKKAKHDTTKALIYLKLSEVCVLNKILDFSNSAIAICNKNLKNDVRKKSSIYLSYKARALCNKGFFYSENEKFDIALKYYDSSRVIQEKIKDRTSLAVTFNNIGYVYELQGLVEKALEHYFKSLKLHEELNNKKELTSCYNNLGSLFDELGDHASALEYYKKSLAIKEIIKDKKGIATVLNNIGLVYYNQNDLEKAMDYYNRSLLINEELKNTIGISILLDNIGGIYQMKGDLTKALFYFNKSLELQKIDENYDGQIVSHTSIGEVYFSKKDYNKAKEHTLIALKYSMEYGYVDQIRLSANRLYSIYTKQKQFEKAIEMRNLEIQMRDSILNEKTKKASFKSQIKYEYEKKAIADSLIVVEDKKITTLKLKQEKTQRFALYGGLALVIIFTGFIFNRFKVTQKQKIIIEAKEQDAQKQNKIITQQKEEVEHQKHIIEEAQKEMSDSINYAKRIQSSFMASKEELDINLNDYFILFKPKDVVSGDFYWANSSNNYFYLCTADSTGHGIPGAFMSLLNISLLNEAVFSRNLINTSDILNFVRKILILGVKADESGQGGKDGMDCSLMRFDFVNQQLTYSAANNPIWIIRQPVSSIHNFDNGANDNQNKMLELIELKPDKMPVGKHDKQDVSFTQHQIQLQKGDVIYTLTDGFSDQFGGPNGKKFMSKKLRELLLANAHLPMHQQKELLENTFTNWVGNTEQIDDVTLIGIRV